MSLLNCLIKIKNYVKESGLSENISNTRIEYFAKRLEAISADSLTPTEFNKKAKALITETMARESAQQRASTAQSIYRREMNLRDLQANTEKWASDKKGPSSKDAPTEAFRVLQQGGSLIPGQGTNMSTPVMADSIRKDLLRLFNSALDKIQGLKDAAQSGALDKDALIELASIDNKTEGMTTKNTAAREYAKVLKIVRDRILERKQAINPYMESAEGYLWKQMHDRTRITEMGKEAWTQLIMSNAGEKSFPELSLQEKKLRFGDMYDKIQQGKWGNAAYEGEPYGRGKNVAKGQATSRQIQFNSPKSFADYNALAGPKTLFDGLMKITNNASNDIALMEKWGPNPEAGRMDTLSKFQKSLDGEQLEQFKRDKPLLDRQWSVVKGSQNAPAYSNAAKVAQGAMSLQYLVHGGFSSFRSPQDIGMAASLLHSLDQSGMVGHAAEVASNFAKGMASSEFRNTQLERLGLFSKSMQRELVRELGSVNSPPGMLSSLAQGMGTLNLHTRIVDAMSASIGHVLTNMLGDISGMRFSELPDSWKQGLARYGFDEHKWDIARLGIEMIEGKNHLTPEGIQNLPDVAVENYLRKSGQFTGEKSPSQKMMNRGRDQLQLSLGTMVNEHAQLSSARTDVRQRDFLWGDTTINDKMGMLRRVLSEFKAASLVQNDVARRAYYSGTSPKGDLSSVAKLVAINAMLFGIGDAAKNIASGKTPEDPKSLNYLGKVVLGSGAGGIYLDTLVNAMNEDSIKDKSYEALKSTAGPIIGAGVEGIMTGAQALTQGKGAAKGAVQWGLGNLVPYQNLPYTKAIFDYHIAHQLKEMVSPGHKYYVEKRANQKGQSYFMGRPTSNTFWGK